ncbi:Oidioi.mRNA.OKI2018_I69.PAR.g9969.t1.cds [Oikopleura dioica]|uniref:Oidioi.mRNA.OKI2018_I69.PAR.g9969.t1.cds n=1 Tax=Oikopleura dioica TaxID=34765 RepID=A0ABN7RSB1_OIKDI|nr:Oidioi.mRNA.OKI2018_I69.PAR.g9969.t1.cds [Oikopleura dioica]
MLFRDSSSDISLCLKGDDTDACFWIINITLPILYSLICAFAVGKTFRDKRALDKLQMAEAMGGNEEAAAENPAFDDIEKSAEKRAEIENHDDTEF